MAVPASGARPRTTSSSGLRTSGGSPRTGCGLSTSWSPIGTISIWVTTPASAHAGITFTPTSLAFPTRAGSTHPSALPRSDGSPDGSLEPGSEPLRWKSTAFNIDGQAAKIRFFYDNPSGARSAWNDPTYAPCQKWPSIGGWYRPYPWGNPDQAGYIKTVRAALDRREWASPSFLNWSPSSFPPGVVFR